VERAPVVELQAVPVRVPPEPVPSTSTVAVQPSRTFAVTGSIEVPENIAVEEQIPEVPRCIASVTVCPSSAIGPAQDGGTQTSVTYVVHHSLPGKMATGDTLVRSSNAPYRDLRTDLAESPSLEIRKKGKLRSGDYGPVLETVTYVVCYQVGGPDEMQRNAVNELHRPNYRITGTVGPTSSIEDTADSYTLTGLSGGPPPYSEEQESLYMAILNYAARSQDNWQREVPVSVTYITQQDFPKAIDSNTLSLSRKGPTVEAREASPPPTPTPPEDEEIWVKQRVVVVEPLRAEAKLPVTPITSDVFAEAMEIVQQAEADADISPPAPVTVSTEYRGWRRDDEVLVRQPAADVVAPRYQVEVRAEVSPHDVKEPFVSAETSPADDVAVTASVFRPEYLPDDAEIAYRATVETPEVRPFPDAKISTTRAYVFHEQFPSTDVQSSGTEALTSEVDVITTPVSAYVEVTPAGSDTLSRMYVVHRDWPSLKPHPAELDRHGTLAEALEADSLRRSEDVTTSTYVVRYDWPKITEPAIAEGDEEPREAVDVAELRAAPVRDDVPRMYVVHRRESPTPETAPGYATAVSTEGDVSFPAAEAEALTLESPENVISHVYIVRRDWPQLKVPQPEVGRDLSVRLGTPTNIGPAPTGDVTASTYVVHHDLPAVKPDLPVRQRPVSDVVRVPVTQPSATEAEEFEVRAPQAAAAPSVEVSQSYTVRYDLPTTTVEVSTPKPRVTFAPAVIETDLDLVSPPSRDFAPAAEISYEVKYGLPSEKEPPTSAAVGAEPMEVRVPDITVSAAGPDEGSYRVQTTYDSDSERDWPWFKADSPALRLQKPAVSEAPPSVAVDVSRGIDFYVDASTEVPSRELMSKTYIVRQNWPELKLETASRATPDVGLAGALASDKGRRELSSRTYIVNYEWPPAKTTATADIGASTSAEVDDELSPTYLDRLDRSRVKIHLPGPDRSREAEVEVIPVEPEDEPSTLPPPGDNLVTHTYIVHHDWPRVKLLLTEPKPAMTDDDLFTSPQLDMVTYVVHCDRPSRKTKEPVENVPPEMFVVEPPDAGVDLSVRGGTYNEFYSTVDLEPRSVDDLPEISVRPPESRHVEFEQPTVAVVTEREPEVRLRLETDIDEVLRGEADDFVVQHELPPVKFQEEVKPIHVRQPALVVAAPEPEVDRRLYFETDIDLPDVEPIAAVAADVDIPIPVVDVQARRDEEVEPPSVTVVAPVGDVDTHTYIVHHHWPGVKLRHFEPKRRLDAVVESDRELVSKTYVVHYDWPTLKIRAPATTRIAIEEPDSRAEIAIRGGEDEPVPSVVFHYDVPSVDIQEPEEVHAREPSIEVITTRGADVTDVEAGAAAAAVPAVTYLHAGQESPSGELTSHTYIVHRDWPRVKLTLPEPKRTLTAAGSGVDVDNESVSGTLERKSYIVHYDWPMKKTKRQAEEEPELPTIAVCPMPPPILVETKTEQPSEEITVTPRVVADETSEGEAVKYVVEYQIGPAKRKQLREEVVEVAGETPKVVSPAAPVVAGRDTEIHPAAVAVVAPSGDVVTHTYIVHRDWPKVKLTLSEPKRRFDIGPHLEGDREFVSKTYVVHNDWPSLTVQVPVTGPSTKIIIEEPERGSEATERSESDIEVKEPVPSVVFHYDVPSVYIEEPEPVRVREPSIEMMTTEGTVDVTDVQVGAAVAAPTVTYIDAGPEPDVKIYGEVRPSGDVISHTYIVHRDWPRVKLTLPEPKRTLVAPGIGGDVVVESAAGTLERKTYIVHYDLPAKGEKIVSVVPRTEVSDQPEPSTLAVTVPPAIESGATDRQPFECVVEYRIEFPKSKEPRVKVAEVVRETPETVMPTVPEVIVTDETVEPAAVSVIPPSGDMVTHTYIVHHDWPKVKLTLSQPKRRYDIGLHGEPSAEIDRQFISRTYVVHYDWPSLKIKPVQLSGFVATTGIEEPATAAEVRVRGEPEVSVDATVSEPLPSVVVQYEVPEVEIQEPQPVWIPEPTVTVITEPRPEPPTSVETPLGAGVDVNVDFTVDKPYPMAVVQHDFLPTVLVQEPEPLRVPEPVVQTVAEPVPGVDLRIRYETDVDLAFAEPDVTPTVAVAAAAAPVAVTCIEEGKDEPTEPAITVVAPSEDVDIHTFIVHHDWPKVKLTISKPKAKLAVSGFADVEETASSKVMSLTYVVHWPSVTDKPAPAAAAELEMQPLTTVSATEPATIEVRVDEEPRPSAYIRTEVEVPEIEVEGTVPTPDVPALVVTVPSDEEILPAAVSVSVASGDAVTYIVHHDWPRVKLTVPEPKRTLDHTAGEDADVDRISRTYVVHYEWPAIQAKKASKSELPTGAAIRAVDSGTDVSGEVDVDATKPASDEVTATYTVHYDWPTRKVKVEKQLPTAEVEVTQKADVTVDQPEIAQPRAAEISLEPEEPILVETVVVSAPDLEEPEPDVPAGEERWQLPVTDIAIEAPTVIVKPHLEIEGEPAVDEEATRVLDIEPSPLVVATAAELPSITAIETKPSTPPVTETTLTFIIEYRLDKTAAKVTKPEAASVEVGAPMGEETVKELLVKEPQEEIGPETITYVVTYDVSKKEAGKPTEVKVQVERRRSSVEEAPSAEPKPPEVETPRVELEPSAGVIVAIPAAPEKPEEKFVEYVVEYEVESVKGKPPRLFRKKVTEVSAPETPAEGPKPPEGPGIPVQTQISGTVDVDYDVVKITAPAVIVEGGIEAPRVALPTPERERPEVALTAEVQPSPRLESEAIRIREPELPEISLDKEILVVQPSMELGPLAEVDAAKPAAVEGVVELGKVPSEVCVEPEKPDLDISIQAPSVEIAAAAAELRAGPAPEVEVEAAGAGEEAAVLRETETVTYIVHYEEPAVSAKPSPDDLTVNAKKRRAAGTSEVRIMLRPLHEPLAADVVTSASGLQSLRHLVVVAIDIGTTYSGYAFTLKGKTQTKEKQDEDGEQPQQQQMQKQHTPTVCIFCFIIENVLTD